MRRARRLSAVASGLLAAALVAACSSAAPTANKPAAPAGQPANQVAGQPTASGGAPSAPAAPMKMRSAYTTIAGSVAPWWVAVDGGYFREQGLDVELLKIDPGAALLAALSNGDVDITYSGAPAIVLAYLQGLKTKIVGSTSNRLDNYIFSRGNEQTLQDLRGKTVGVSRLKAVSDVSARMAFQSVGMNPDTDVIIRGTGGYPETMAGLENGTLDSGTLSVEASVEARKRGYKELANLGLLDLLFMNGAVAATTKAIEERPEAVDRTMRALAQATARLLADRAYAIQVYQHYSQITDTALLEYLMDAYVPYWPPDLYPDPKALQAVLDAEENPGARTTTPDEIIDMRFYERLKASGFLDTLPR